jgi:hypothetical protein
MTNDELQVCPSCGQDYLRRVRFRGVDRVYLTCLECDSLWDGERGSAHEARGLPGFEAFCRRHDLTFADDVFWIDLPHHVGQIIRMNGEPSAIGAITGLADRDGRAYDVELIDEHGRTTYSGRLRVDRIYPAGEVWEKRYQQRRARTAGTWNVDRLAPFTRRRWAARTLACPRPRT